MALNEEEKRWLRYGIANNLVGDELADKLRQLKGTVVVGDVAAASGALAVTGDITSASALSAANSTTVTINYPSTPSPVVIAQIESLGDVNNDNDLEHPVILNVTDTSCDMYLYESGAVTQNLKLHILIL